MKTLRLVVLTSGMAALLALSAHAQTNATVEFQPGKLVVYRGGDGVLTIVNDRQHPAFIDEYDPAIANQTAPILTIALPTNAGPGECMWFNAHAGSEGQGLTRSADRTVLTMTGYCDDLGSLNGTTTDTPSSSTNANGQGYNRGFGVIDAFTNFNVPYASDLWYGLVDGVTQCNPRGIATDGTNNFWGCGTIAGSTAGSDSVETGTLFWSASEGGPAEVQTIVNSGYYMKIVNGVLYEVFQTDTGGATENGIYNFYGYPFSPTGDTLDPLPDPIADVVVNTNLVIDVSSTNKNVLTFDMNAAGTIAYVADNVNGIIKYVNSGGTWTSPYAFNSNNIGSGGQPSGGTGAYGIAVDFSGANPIIYATTMDINDSSGNTCSNRLISLVDTGVVPDPGAVLATTLATAANTNEVFRGLDFTPDLRPEITSQPGPVNIVTNQSSTMSVATECVLPQTFQWQVNGTNAVANANLTGTTTATLHFVNAVTSLDGNYTCIVSDQYGAVTSVVANAFISLTPIPPTINNGNQNITAFVGYNEQFSVNPQGTPPFTYQWFDGAASLQNGSKYAGVTSSNLVISNLQTSDSGSYYVTISNQSGENPQFLYANLNVIFENPVIPAGEPTSIGIMQGSKGTLSIPSVVGTPPLGYQWYQGNLENPVQNNSVFSGAQTSTLTISNPPVGVASYFCVVTNQGGGATSPSATVTCYVPSVVAYNGGFYAQNFDSMPDCGTSSVNASTGIPTTIPASGPDAVNYFVSNPFDFAAPISFGGLGLSNTMAGWYSSDLGNEQIQASTGDQTTGLIDSFGCQLPSTNLNFNPNYPTNNRSLGIIASPATSGADASGQPAIGIFAVRIKNTTSQTLTNMNVSYLSELWRNSTTLHPVLNWYYVDPTGTNWTPTNNLTGNLTTLSYAGATATSVSSPVAITGENFVDFPLATTCPPGGIIWIVWEQQNALSKAQGIGIDNFVFSSGQPTLAISHVGSSVVISWPAMFTAFALQSSTDMSQNNWQNVTGGSKTAVDGINYLTLPAGGAQTFYRLHSSTGF